MEYVFTPEHIVLNDLFGNDMEYIIPEYQRPYSWDCIGKSDRNNQINLMWDDIFSFFESGKTGEYFLGSMVLIGGVERSFEVIDGQQRLTTLLLLFTSIKCFCTEVLERELYDGGERHKNFLERLKMQIDNLLFNEKTFGALVIEKKVKVQKNTDYDYDKILSDVMNCKSTPKRRTEEDINESEYDIAALRYYGNRDFFIEQLNIEFLTNELFTNEDAEKLNRFFDFLKNRVSLVRIKTTSFDVAYHVFEILNNRGLPLSNKDLLRNFIIKEFDKLRNEHSSTHKNISPADIWNDLEKDYDFKDDFIGRWVESRTARQQRYSAFNDLKEIYDNMYFDDALGKKRIEKLYHDIKNDLYYYSLISNPKFIQDKRIRNKILFLQQAGNFRYTANLLMALFRMLDYNGQQNDDIARFITFYEKHLLSLLLYGRFSNVPVYNAISYLLSNGNITDALLRASEEFMLDGKDERLLSLSLAHRSFSNFNGKLLLAKYVWYLDSLTDEDIVDQTLFFPLTTLEHIIPQNPSPDSEWVKKFPKEFREEYTFRLGNMTLLTQRINSSIKNSDFAIKKEKYKLTKLSLTTELSVLTSIDSEYLKKRHQTIVNGIMKDLSLPAVENP